MTSFTAEEIWASMPGERGESVLFETWYEGIEGMQSSPEQRRYWTDLLAIRDSASRVLEGMRKAGDIGASLEAQVDLFLDNALLERYTPAAGELRFVFITSELTLAPLAAKPAHAVKVELAEGEAWLAASVRTAAKCIRCWHLRDDVGVHGDHPEICGRCVENVAGQGEVRRWF
jgi:isoleucyl-tRNA synthetase